jgi:hypothetical protein
MRFSLFFDRLPHQCCNRFSLIQCVAHGVILPTAAIDTGTSLNGR